MKGTEIWAAGEEVELKEGGGASDDIALMSFGGIVSSARII